MKPHIGTDAGTGYIRSVTATPANVHDLDLLPALVRGDDAGGYADASYQRVARRPEVAADAHPASERLEVAARKTTLAAMAGPGQVVQARRAGVRAKVENPFLTVTRDVECTTTCHRGMPKNLHHLHMIFTSANWLMGARALVLTW